MKKVKISTKIFAILHVGVLVSLSACTTLNEPPYIPAKTQTVIKKAEQQGFVPNRYNTSLVTYTAWEKYNQDSHVYQDIHVYIEGDGNSWKTKFELSDNPTPKNPLSLKLAMQDSYPRVVYLARPCQYLYDEVRCDSAYWSNARYSETVVKSMNEVLDQIKQRQPFTRFLLVGFSGGGNIAALLSARRHDIRGLITVAGNLDHAALNKHHHVTPLKDSLNAMDYQPRLREIPQRHFVGGKDDIVPPWLIKQYTQALHSECVSMRVINNNTHHKGWVEQWPIYLKETLPCQSMHITKLS